MSTTATDGRKVGRYTVSRQKVCKQCSDARVRCDRKASGCTRCRKRGDKCLYLSSSTSIQSPRNVSKHHELVPNSLACAIDDLSADVPLCQDQREQLDNRHEKQSIPISDPNTASSGANLSSQAHRPQVIDVSSLANRVEPTNESPPTFDFTDLELLCPIDANDISCRWLKPYFPTPGQKLKNYPTNVIQFMSRILKSYANVSVTGQSLPPFLHFSETTEPTTYSQLATCLSIIRVCGDQRPGSKDAAADIIREQLFKLYQSHTTFSDMALFTTFQASLVYSMVYYYFQLDDATHSFLHQAMMNLQEIACASVQRGVLCSAELQSSKPRWEAWIVAEAKRRTLFTMYMFDSLLTVQDNLPNYLSSELTGLLAPGPKILWEAQDRHEWGKHYNQHLASWSEPFLSIDELWPLEVDSNNTSLTNRRRRVDRWLQEVDEFGTMLFAVTSMTHGT